MSKLKIGDNAPAFNAKDQNGKEHKLDDYKGKKIVIYFYPKDNTPGCTMESCNLRDNYERFQSLGYEILGVSSNSETSHIKFKDRFNLPFDLIADTDKKMHEQFGTWVQKSMFGKKYMGTSRTTFVIDENGVIIDIITKVKTTAHTKQILLQID